MVTSIFTLRNLIIGQMCEMCDLVPSLYDDGWDCHTINEFCFFELLVVDDNTISVVASDCRIGLTSTTVNFCISDPLFPSNLYDHVRKFVVDHK